jgi:hypothetical protein
MADITPPQKFRTPIKNTPPSRFKSELASWGRGAKIAGKGLFKDFVVGVVGRWYMRTFGPAGFFLIPDRLFEWATRDRWDLVRWPKKKKLEEVMRCPVCQGACIVPCAFCEGAGQIKDHQCITCGSAGTRICGVCRGKGVVTANDLM